jgi:hypothetical protein
LAARAQNPCEPAAPKPAAPLATQTVVSGGAVTTAVPSGVRRIISHVLLSRREISVKPGRKIQLEKPAVLA